VSPALVIVGAGPGLGAAIAARFAKGGWDVGLIGRRQDTVDALLTDLSQNDVARQGAVADATDRASLDRALDELTDGLGVPSVMIYNASLYQPQPALELSADDLQRSFDVHVLGAFNAARGAIRLMCPVGRGVVTFTINCLALYPEAVSAAMSIGKGAQHNLALSFDAELEATGVKVAIVTITAPIKPHTAFDPTRIAELYWRVANQAPGRFERDHTFAGDP